MSMLMTGGAVAPESLVFSQPEGSREEAGAVLIPPR